MATPDNADEIVYQAILADIRAAASGAPDQSIRRIADRYNVSTRKVRTIARDNELGHAWSNRADHTAAATAARVADMRQRRLDFADRLLEEAEGLVDQIHQPHIVFNIGGKDNTYTEHLLDRPPTSDIRNLMQSAAIAFDRHLAALKHDTFDGSEASTSLVGQLAAGFTAAYEELKRQESGGEGVDDDDAGHPEPRPDPETGLP